MILIVYLLEQNSRHEGYGDTGNAFKFNDHTLAALDTADDTCDAVKNTACDQNTLAFLANDSLVVEEQHTVIMVCSCPAVRSMR